MLSQPDTFVESLSLLRRLSVAMYVWHCVCLCLYVPLCKYRYKGMYICLHEGSCTEPCKLPEGSRSAGTLSLALPEWTGLMPR